MTIRYLNFGDGRSPDDALAKFLDRMPRKPVRFLAMAAEAERRRAQIESSQARKARGRQRYLKRYARRASPAQRVSRQAEHGPGEILDTGYARSARRKPTPADRVREVGWSNTVALRRVTTRLRPVGQQARVPIRLRTPEALRATVTVT